MRSIGRSLTISFLLLLLGVLGGTAIVADRMLNRTLAEKEAAAEESIRLHTKEQAEEAAGKLDQKLLSQARAIGMNLQLQYLQQVRKQYDTVQAAMQLSLIDMGFVPTWHGSFWTAAHLRTRRGYPFLASFTIHSFLMSLEMNDLFLASEEMPGASSYVQITNNVTGTTWLSDHLKITHHLLPVPSPESIRLIDWHWSNVELPDHFTGRRVIFQTPLYKAGLRVRSNEEADIQPLMMIQCATPLAPLDAEIQAIRDDAEARLEELRAKSQREQTSARLGMAAVGLMAFLAVIIGAPILIGRGLAPMRKLSHAVSQVNERDFRLPVEAADLSRELLPIHERLQRTLESLKRAFDREKQAVGDISHELRTPLAALLATIEVSLRKPREVSVYQETLQNSRTICKQMSRLVDRIMTLATLDSNEDRFKTSFTDAIDVVESCETLIRPLAESNGLSFQTEVPDSAWLMTDADKLREVLINLLHNAIEYNRPEGTITLTLHDIDDDLVFEVSDTGIGMTDEVRSHIFERFYRADSSRHATGIHAGLGLAVVKEYLERMDATIEVQSMPNKGTTFRVRVSKRMEQHPAIPEHSDAERLGMAMSYRN